MTAVQTSCAGEWAALIDGTGKYVPTRGFNLRGRRRGALIRCAACGRWRLNYEGPHSTQAHPDGRVTDCTGGGNPQ